MNEILLLQNFASFNQQEAHMKREFQYPPQSVLLDHFEIVFYLMHFLLPALVYLKRGKGNK